MSYITANTARLGTWTVEHATVTNTATKTALDVNLINGSMSGVVWDRVDVTYPDSVTEVYTFKLSGSTVATFTVTYTDSSKANLSSVVRS